MIEPPEVFVLGPYIRNMLGKPGHGHAEVGVGALRPAVAQAAAAGAGDLHREHEVVGLEAGRPDQAVDLVQPAVGGPQALRLDALDRLGHELDVRALQRRQVVGAEEDPLAPEGVVRPGFAAHLAGRAAASA